MRIEIIPQADFEKCIPSARKFHEIYEPTLEFSPGQFLRFWNRVYDNHNGFMLGLYDEHKNIIGGIGGVFTDFMTSEALTCVEMFWWVDEDRRGGWGLRLIKEFENLAKASGCARIAMAYMESSMPDRMQKLYDKLGYSPYEHHYMKWL